MDNLANILYILADHHKAEVQTLGLNTDFLEANVINIILLLLGLIYILKNFLGSTLIIRQQKVLTAIQESEQRLNEANIRLEEAEIKKQIQKQITTLAIQRVTSQLKDQIKPDIQASIIDNHIMQLKYKL